MQVNFKTIETAEEIEFNAGYDSYYAGRESIVGESRDFREGFKQAWYEANRLPDWKDPEGVRKDQNWEAFAASL